MRRRDRLPAGWADIRTVTGDGVALAGMAHPGPSGRTAGVQFAVCHGMTNSTRKPGTRAVLSEFARYGPVVAFDFRGHGESDGKSTVGADETADAAAAVRVARARSDRPVVLVGFSMGAAVVLRQQGVAHRAAVPDEVADAVVSVSAPARWFLRESRSMRKVQWLLEHPSGGLIGPRLGIRLGPPWPDVPTTPLQEVGTIAPTPLLLVHGTLDHYFGTDQARALHRAAPGSQLWIVDGMGHAESGVDPATIERIAGWAAEQIATITSRPADADDPDRRAATGTLD